MIRFLSASYKIISGSFEVSSRILIPNSDNRLSSLCNVRSDVSPIYNNSDPDAKLGTKHAPDDVLKNQSVFVIYYVRIILI